MPSYITDDSLLSQLNAPASPLDKALHAEGMQDHPAADIARSIYQQESSSGRNTRTSNAGAVGGMQIIPDTFKRMADPGWDINDPEHNARAGVRYVKALYEQAGGDPKLTAAGYYGGEGGLEKARQGVAVSDPRNPKAPNTLQYADQVAGRLPTATPVSAAATSTATPGRQYVQDPDLLTTLNARPTAPAAPATSDGTSQPVKSFLQGLRDPIDGLTQMVAHGAESLRSAVKTAVPAAMQPDVVAANGDPMTAINNAVADKTGLVARLPAGGIDAQIQQNEKAYQAERANAGSTGFDGYRTIGNIANPASWAPVERVAQGAGLLARTGIATVNGAASAAAQPVASGDDFGGEKIKQVALGGVGGALMTPVASAIARLVSPAASTNSNVQLLKDAGVQPTIGQTLGGRFNATEEKLQSVPILGDMITRARGQAREQFDTAAINRATAPINEKVTGAGQEAVKEAGDKLSAAYNAALAQVQGVPLDVQFHADLSQLRQMAQGLVPGMRDKFEKTLNDVVLGRAGPANTLLGPTYKKVDGELGQLAAKYGKSSLASEQELGDAVGQLQSLLKQQMKRTNPHVASQLDAADEGWANLVRVEQAAKAAHNNDGVFTPGQLNSAIRSADDSVRGRAVARGDALMQDLGNAGQQVLGNKVPDSGTAGRVMGGIGALATGAISPAIPLSLAAGGLAYTGPIQSALRAAVSSRPQAAQPVAKTIREAAPLLAPAGAQLFLAPTKE